MSIRLVVIAMFVFAFGSAWAAPVDPGNPNGIVAVVGATEWPTILCADGAPYIMQIGVQSGVVVRVYWEPLNPSESGPVPVPIEQILDWTPRLLQTRGGEIYVYDGNNRAWYNVSPGAAVELAPCAGEPVTQGSGAFGLLKVLFR